MDSIGQDAEERQATCPESGVRKHIPVQATPLDAQAGGDERRTVAEARGGSSRGSIGSERVGAQPSASSWRGCHGGVWDADAEPARPGEGSGTPQDAREVGSAGCEWSGVAGFAVSALYPAFSRSLYLCSPCTGEDGGGCEAVSERVAVEARGALRGGPEDEVGAGRGSSGCEGSAAAELISGCSWAGSDGGDCDAEAGSADESREAMAGDEVGLIRAGLTASEGSAESGIRSACCWTGSNGGISDTEAAAGKVDVSTGALAGDEVATRLAGSTASEEFAGARACFSCSWTDCNPEGPA
ncbi:hypothetical protein OH77DRAFT_1020953 [Trametes cingulata]|nr:hypothetical protein OH77DRAFT_1020953 [Trametes cingulata]